MPSNMYPFSGLHGCINGRNNFHEINNQDKDNISYIWIAYFFMLEDNRNRPPKGSRIKKENEELGDKRLCTVPFHKSGRLPIAQVENNRCK